ncbi:MAG: shikimate kinase [Deltaproteobacteria bacterium]|nr:shikimate kinase [Deltaproteobacteria bacterium]
MAPNIYITGFMGAGKTRTGLLLAQKLNRRFLDTDTLIVNEAQMTITEIFEKKGEAWFRALESRIIGDLSQRTSLVVGLGGGAILDEKNRQVLSRGIWVFIDTSFQIIKERVGRRSHRPLAQDPKKFEELYNQRLPLYRQAAIIISNKEDAEVICQSIIQEIINGKNS